MECQHPNLSIELTTKGYRAIGQPGDAAVERDKSNVLRVIPKNKNDAKDIQALRRATKE